MLYQPLAMLSGHDSAIYILFHRKACQLVGAEGILEFDEALSNDGGLFLPVVGQKLGPVQGEMHGWVPYELGPE